MPSYHAPGSYVEERSGGVRPIEGVSTSVAAFLGAARKGPVGQAVPVDGFAQFERVFGGPIPAPSEHFLYYAVRDFFRHGGRSCLIVRIAHFADPGDLDSLTAVAAHRSLPGRQTDDSEESDAFEVAASSPGDWGEALSVRVEAASRYSHALLAPLAASDAEEAALAPNGDVRIGSVLSLIQEVTGEIESVDETNQKIILSAAPVHRTATGVEPFDATLPPQSLVFTPGFRFESTLTAEVDLSAADPADPVELSVQRVTGADGKPLQAGQTLSVGHVHRTVVLNSVSSGKVAGEDATIVGFDTVGSPESFAPAATRAYARDFHLAVLDGKEEVERHEHLSLLPEDERDYVGIRLPEESQRIRAVRAESASSIRVATHPLASSSQESAPALALENGADDFANIDDADFIGSEALKTGIHALDDVYGVSILCVPNATEPVVKDAIAYCEGRKDLFYVIDQHGGTDHDTSAGESAIAAFRTGKSSSYAALYTPWLRIAQPGSGLELSVPPCGAVAGVMARTDARRGVHKAPAGLDTGGLSVQRLDLDIAKEEADRLYQADINPIRTLREGITVWGARTLAEDPEWQYVNVRRLFIFLEQSILRATDWVVFEPNGPSLWKSVERTLRSFLRVQWREGKLVGDLEEEAFRVRCDAETNPPEVVDAGQLVAEIAVAPSKPGEFVIFRIRQLAGRAAA